jgi:hypothetical protein
VSRPDRTARIRTALSRAVPGLVASGIAGPLVLAAAQEDRNGTWLSLRDTAGNPVTLRVEVGPLAGGGAQLQAASGPGYQVIRVSDRAAPGTAGALLAAGLKEARAAREAEAQPGNLLVAGTAVPDRPRLTLADRAHLSDLDRTAAAMGDPQAGPREQDASRRRFTRLAGRLGLQPALPGDARAVRTRQGIAVPMLSPAAAAALRGPDRPPRRPQAGHGDGRRHGPGTAAGALAPLTAALPLAAAAARQAQTSCPLPASGRRALTAGTPARPALTAGRGPGLTGAVTAPAGQALARARATQRGLELEL